MFVFTSCVRQPAGLFGALMSKRLNFAYASALSRATTIGRGNTRLVRNYSNAQPSSIATETTSSATEPDSVPLMPSGLAGYTPMFEPPRRRIMPSRIKEGLSHYSPKPTVRSKLPPSPESGGVPEPTLEYVLRAGHPPFILSHPRSLLVVIDMNGTLLFRPDHRKPTVFVERPFARQFLSYCVNTFKVVIWSSARPDNVRNMCAQLLTTEDRAKLVAVWARDRMGLSKADYDKRVQCYKRLSVLWNDPTIAASHPMAAHGENWNQTNTVLVDDSTEKARSEPFNLIQVPDFRGNAHEPGFVLPQVHDFLNVCSQQVNVSAFLNEQPFEIKPDYMLRAS